MENIPYENIDEIVTEILDIGEILLTSGAEVSRVEDTMKRLGDAYGFARSDIFAITSSIVYTVSLENGKTVTQTRRITSSSDDMEKIERVNELSRKICETPVSADQLKKQIEEIKAVKSYPLWLVFLSYVVISSSFTVFFGGVLRDGIASAFSGSVLFITDYFGQKFHIQKMVKIILSSVFTGLAAVFMINTGIGVSFDKIVIGNIMLLIPGKAFTNSIRDVIKGDIISGALGLLAAVFEAAGIALGISFVMIIKGVA